MKGILLLALLSPDLTKVGSCGREFMEPFSLKTVTEDSILKDTVQAGIVADLSIADMVLMLAIMRYESSFNPTAKGPTGDIGMMQITAVALKDAVKECALPVVPDINTQYGNIVVGACYLKWIKKRLTNPSYADIIIAYNAGLSSVEKDPRRLRKSTLVYSVNVERLMHKCYTQEETHGK